MLSGTSKTKIGQGGLVRVALSCAPGCVILYHVTGIRRRFTEKLEDLDFADDLALLSSTRRQLQFKNERLSNASKGTGLKINITKTKVMRFNPASEEKVIVNGGELEDVDSFVHLGAKVSTAGGADDYITSRLCEARSVFGKLWGVWKAAS